MPYQLSHRPNTAPNHSTASIHRITTKSNKTQKLCTLDTIGDNDTHIQLNTPRSVECCRRLGIDPNVELIYHPPEYFIDKFPSITYESQLINKHIPNYATIRYEHHNIKRKHKLDQLRKLRSNLSTVTDANGHIKVVDHNDNNSNPPSTTTPAKHSWSTAPDTVTAINNEKRNVQRMHQREMSKIKNRVLYELRCATLKSTQLHELQQQHQLDEQYRIDAESYRKQRNELELQLRLKHQQQLDAEAEQQRIEQHNQWLLQQQSINQHRQQQLHQQRQHRQQQIKSAELHAVKKKQLDDILEQQQQRVNNTAVQLAEREQKRLESLQQSRVDQLQHSNKSNKKKQLRYRAQLDAHQRIEQQKRELYEHRAALAEQRQHLLHEQKLQQQHELQHQIQLKAQHAEKCRLDAEAVLQAKRNAVLEKHDATRKRLELEESNRVHANKQHDIESARKEQHRINIYNTNQQLMTQRVAELNQRIQSAEQRHQQLLTQKEYELANKKLQEQLIQSDRQEHIQHTERIQQYKRDQLLQRVENDTKRVELIKLTKQQLLQQKHQIRDDAWLQTTQLVNEFDSIAHRSQWHKLQSTDENENILLKSGVVTKDELIDVLYPKQKRSSRPNTATHILSTRK